MLSDPTEEHQSCARGVQLLLCNMYIRPCHRFMNKSRNAELNRSCACRTKTPQYSLAFPFIAHGQHPRPVMTCHRYIDCPPHPRHPSRTSNRIETLGPRPSKTFLSWSRRRFVRECKASVSGIPHSSGPSIQKIIGRSNDTSSIYLLMLLVCGLYIF